MFLVKSQRTDELRMGRGDFFRWSLKMLKEKSIDAVQKSVGEAKLFIGITEEEDTRWSKVALLEQLSDRPKLMFFQGQPYYLGLVEGEVNAFKATCPQDNNILRWQENSAWFGCMACTNKYSRKGEVLESTGLSKMLGFKTKEVEGVIFVSFNR
ncbi:MAG: hypothetical protein KGZ96_11840 [Clostridia bacterium]|nr:hypothetical protein [Clostridia bacterium]